MRSATIDRDQIVDLAGTAKDKAGTARDKVVPVLTTARDKGLELLESDAAHELAKRGKDVVRAARGVKPPKRRRWPIAMLFLGVGTAIGAAVSRFLNPPEQPTYDTTSYTTPTV